MHASKVGTSVHNSYFVYICTHDNAKCCLLHNFDNVAKDGADLSYKLWSLVETTGKVSNQLIKIQFQN